MREIGIEQFKRAMVEQVQNLPIAVTRRGKVVFVVASPEDNPEQYQEEIARMEQSKLREKTHSWRTLRYEALKRGSGVCSLCGRSPLEHSIVLHVDHIKPRSLYPELEFNIDNLQVLCAECNIGKSNTDETDWRNHTVQPHGSVQGAVSANAEKPLLIVEDLKEKVKAVEKKYAPMYQSRWKGKSAVRGEAI